MSDQPVIIGGHSLWIHGWTTQQHRLRELAVPEGSDLPVPAGERHFARSAEVMEILQRVSEPCDDYLLAPPAYALADMILHRSDGLWWPGASDLDEDEVAEHRGAIVMALEEFGGDGCRIDEILMEDPGLQV